MASLSLSLFSSVHCFCFWLSPFFSFKMEKEMVTHSSVLAWRIPRTAEPGGLPSMGSHRVGHDWCDLAAAVANKFWGNFWGQKRLKMLSMRLYSWMFFHFIDRNNTFPLGGSVDFFFPSFFLIPTLNQIMEPLFQQIVGPQLGLPWWLKW